MRLLQRKTPKECFFFLQLIKIRSKWITCFPSGLSRLCQSVLALSNQLASFWLPQNKEMTDALKKSPIRRGQWLSRAAAKNISIDATVAVDKALLWWNEFSGITIKCFFYVVHIFYGHETKWIHKTNWGIVGNIPAVPGLGTGMII